MRLVLEGTQSHLNLINPACDIDVGNEPLLVLEEMIEVQEFEVKVQGLDDNEEMSDNFSCISVEKVPGY